MYDPNDYPENGDNSGGDFIPVGKHIVTVIDHELGKTSGGYAQMVVNFRASNGRTRKAWLIYEGKAGFQLGQLLRAVGWNDKLDVESDLAVRKAIYHKPLQIVVEEETYQGKTQPKVKYMNKAPAGTNGTASYDERNPPPPDGDIPF